MNKSDKMIVAALVVCVFLIVGAVTACVITYQYYKVWDAEMTGRAIEAQAEFSRRAALKRIEVEVEMVGKQLDNMKTLGLNASEYSEFQLRTSLADALEDGKIANVTIIHDSNNGLNVTVPAK